MAVFDKLGIRFQYPDNWTLDETEALAGERSVTVYSPEGAFWSLTLHPPLEPAEPLLQAVLKTMRKEYAELDAEEVSETIADVALTGYDLNFYCLDLTNTALVRVAHTPEITLLLMCQAEDREYQRVERVFQAMTTSLLRR